MKVAIVHYWLVGMRGGEKVIEALCEVFPQADIYTHVYRPDQVSQTIREREVTTTFIDRLPFAGRAYQRYLPLMPVALEQIDLGAYDLVISSESGPAKGVITRPDTLHVCYCHTPMRYVWDMYHEYRRSADPLTRAAMPWLVHRLRLWDYASAARVDHFVANSRYVAGRIRKYYRREAEVVHPPVDVDAFAPAATLDEGYLFVSQLVGYKRADVAVEAFNRMGRRLVVIGDGPELGRLRRLAGPTVSLLGRQPFPVMRDHYARCQALIFPAEEDFGIVPVEAMASGRPVIAFRKGGATETVVPDVTGVFFDRQTPEALIAAVERYEAGRERFRPEALVEHARGFDRAVFKRRMRELVEGWLAEAAGR